MTRRCTRNEKDTRINGSQVLPPRSVPSGHGNAENRRSAASNRHVDAVTNDVRAVSLQEHAACPFSIAHEYAVEYLRRAEAGEDEAVIRVPIAFLPGLIRRRVAITFGLHDDVAEGGRSHDEIRLRWSAGMPCLPDFRGTLRFRIAGTETDVLVDGSYRIPFGALGRAFDNLAGRHIARASLRDFARRIAGALETGERAWRKKELGTTRV